MQKVINYLGLAYLFTRNLFKFIGRYFKQGFKGGLLRLYSKHFIVRHLQEFVANIKKETGELDPVDGVRMQKLRQLTGGLHLLLPRDERYSYSILIAIGGKPGEHFKHTLTSALNQTAPQLEVLVGYQSLFFQEVEAIIRQIPEVSDERLRVFRLTDATEAKILNHLAQVAKGTFLLPLRSGDWIRPDFLFRCEQFLRLANPQPFGCLYTDEFAINSHGYPLPEGQWHKPASLCFPYLFKDCVGNSLLIPRTDWLKVGGMQCNLTHQGLWDLALRLDREGIAFFHLPFPLYAHRAILPFPIEHKSDFVDKLEASTQAKGLSWTWKEGLLPHTFRAIPRLEGIPCIQVIIPFKNQKELTLKAVHSVLAQKGVQSFITAVDNNSDDQTIAPMIESLGGEVLFIQEPFNFSRLNNLAVERTRTAQACDYILFLNNDVELESDALEEMCRWINQPSIGFVGCFLSYPNGLLQHGGVDIKRDGPVHNVTWIHSEKLRKEAKMSESKVLRLTDAVTAACALMKRSVFIEIGGFDEVWYPIAYSDTNLAVKLRAKGLKCFFTPFAKGIHHESISRDHENIEDFENSRWLQHHFTQRLSDLAGDRSNDKQ